MTCPDCGKRHTPKQGCLSGVLLVCGGREYADWQRAEATLDRVQARMEIAILRHGLAPDADSHAAYWAHRRGVTQEPMPADWNAHGRGAGPRRNAAMLAREPRPVACVAFPGGRGTADMVKRCKAAGVPVWEIEP